jgi:MFS family permease
MVQSTAGVAPEQAGFLGDNQSFESDNQSLLSNEQSEPHEQLGLLSENREETYATLSDEDAIEDLDTLLKEDDEHRRLTSLLHWSKRPSVYMISLLCLFYSVATSVAEPSQLIILNKLSCNTVARNGICDPIASQVLVSKFEVYSTVMSTMVSLFAAAKIGEYSDKYGRKVFLSILLMASQLSSIATIVVFNHSKTLPFGLLLLIRLLCLIAGGFPTFMALVNSYVADIVSPTKRRYSIGLCSAGVSIGSALGPILSNGIISFYTKLARGLTIEGLDSSGSAMISESSRITIAASIESDIEKVDIAPLVLGMILWIMLTFASIFILPESRSKKSRSRSISRSRSSVNVQANGSVLGLIGGILNFFKPIMLLTYPDEIVPEFRNKKRDRTIVVSLIVCFLVVAAASTGVAIALVQYGIYKFNWGTTDIGTLLTLLSTSTTIMLVVVSPMLAHFLENIVGFKTHSNQIDHVDLAFIALAYLCDSLTYFGISIAKNSNQMFLAMIISTIGAPGLSANSSAILKYYPPSKIGEFFGAMTLASNILNIGSPIIMTSIYTWGLKNNFASLPFDIVAICFGLGFMMMFVIRYLMR